MNDTLTRSLVSSRTFKPETLTALLVLLGAVLMMLAMKVLNPGFGSVQQIAAILTTSIFLVVAAYGQGLVILLGGIDLSIGVVMSIAGMMIAGLTNGSNEALTWALPVTLISCTAIGVLNGFGVAFLKIPPFIMTLAKLTTNGSSGVAGVDECPNRRDSRTDRVDRLVSGRWFSIAEPDDGGAEALRHWQQPGCGPGSWTTDRSADHCCLWS